MVAEAVKFADGQLEQYLTLGSGVLDIGANGGMLTAIYAAAVGPTGCVLAVEPDPETFAALDNGLRKIPNAKGLHAAVGAAEGETVIYPDGVLTSRYPILTMKAKPGVTVPMTTVDVLAARVPHLRGVKVDVQGSEMDVLAGATATLRRPEVWWQIEVWPKGLRASGASLEAFCAALAGVGLLPVTRSWQTVCQQAAGLKADSYLDVVCRHVH